MICLQEINEINSKPSARYALALFSLCQEDKNITEVEKHVVKLLEVLKSDNGLNAFLRNPTFSSRDQENVFGNISSKIQLPQQLHNAICLMIRKGRGYDLVNFSEDFVKLCLVNKNELMVHIKTAKKIADMLNTNYYHTSFSDDLNGVEVSAAIKNIFSMAVGAAKGLCSKNISDEVREKNYLNTASALIKQSIHEMEIFVEHLKGKKETVKGLAGLGDLYVSSGGGRNAKMGSYIGEGLTFSEAKKTKMEKVTVEGADLAIEIAQKVKEDFDEKKIPLMLSMINAIVEDKKLEFNWEAFR